MALGIPMALLLSAGLTAGGGILGGLLGKDDETNPEDYLAYKQLPDYSESEGARGSWWKTLQDWGASGDYGASDMNWDEIYKTAKDKLNRYYWGSALEPGLAGKVKASAARRNVSQSPALENTLGALGIQQGQDLNSLFSDITTQKATYTESARKNWLSSLMNLAGLKPSFITTANAVQPSNYDTGDLIGDVSSGIGSLFSQYAQTKYSEEQSQKEKDWLENLFRNASGGSGGGSILSPYGSAKSTPDLTYDWYGGNSFK